MLVDACPAARVALPARPDRGARLGVPKRFLSRHVVISPGSAHLDSARDEAWGITRRKGFQKRCIDQIVSYCGHRCSRSAWLAMRRPARGGAGASGGQPTCYRL